MPRDSNGTYTLPAQPTKVIDAGWFNTVLDDMAQCLTDSFAVDGSIKPESLTDDPAGFQAKLGVAALFANATAAVNALMSRNDADIGSVKYSGAGAAAPVPAHHLECLGQAVSRTTYAKLFAKLGTTWGPGNGTTTFNLPSMAGLIARGWDDGRNVDAGRTFASVQNASNLAHTHGGSTSEDGAHTHTASTASAGNHTHGGSTSSDGGHTHTWSQSTGNQSVNHTHSFSATTSSEGAHTHTFTYSWLDAHDANDSVMWVDNGSPYTSSTAGAHTHTISATTGVTLQNHTHSYSFTTSNNGAHTHTLAVAEDGAHTHDVTTSLAGAHTHGLELASTGNATATIRNFAARAFIKYE